MSKTNIINSFALLAEERGTEGKGKMPCVCVNTSHVRVYLRWVKIQLCTRVCGHAALMLP